MTRASGADPKNKAGKVGDFYDKSLHASSDITVGRVVSAKVTGVADRTMAVSVAFSDRSRFFLRVSCCAARVARDVPSAGRR